MINKIGPLTLLKITFEKGISTLILNILNLCGGVTHRHPCVLCGHKTKRLGTTGIKNNKVNVSYFAQQWPQSVL